eukprot:1161047-Pelagomonas_calceolata.AAC.62
MPASCTLVLDQHRAPTMSKRPRAPFAFTQMHTHARKLRHKRMQVLESLNKQVPCAYTHTHAGAGVLR